MALSRRDILIGLSASTPIALGLCPPARADGDSPILQVSRVIAGRDDLDPALALRVQEVLAARIDGFDNRLAQLAKALSNADDRDTALKALSDDQLDLALQIAQPWYIGVIGTSNDHSFDDDAVFITFLGAQAMTLVEDVVPRQSYSTGAPGWWADPPTGVTPPPMPDNIRDWSFQPEGATGEVPPAEPEFLALVTPKETAKN